MSATPMTDGVVSFLPVGCIEVLLLTIEGVCSQVLNCTDGTVLTHSKGVLRGGCLNICFVPVVLS